MSTNAEAAAILNGLLVSKLQREKDAHWARLVHFGRTVAKLERALAGKPVDKERVWMAASEVYGAYLGLADSGYLPKLDELEES